MFDSPTEEVPKANGTSYIRECLEDGTAGRCPFTLGDFTPRYLVYGYHWAEEWMNYGLDQPLMLVPHKMRLMLPNIKLIIMMRDPAQRFFSSYRYFRHIPGTDTKSQADFHQRAIGQAQAWSKCLDVFHEERPCLYGYPAGMTDFWKTDSADQIRIGLYVLYIEQWLSVFPKNQFLFINFDVFKKSPIEYIEKYVLPFLELEPYTDKVKVILKLIEERENQQASSHDGELKDMRDDSLQLLNNFYGPYNERLASLLNDSSYLWHLPKQE